MMVVSDVIVKTKPSASGEIPQEALDAGHRVPTTAGSARWGQRAYNDKVQQRGGTLAERLF